MVVEPPDLFQGTGSSPGPAGSRPSATRLAGIVPSSGKDRSHGLSTRSVDGAIGDSSQIGSTPYSFRCASMKRTITPVSSRAPPGRNRQTPCGGSRWSAEAREPHARAPSGAPARSSSGPPAVRRSAPPGEPTAAAAPPCTRSSRRRTGSQLTASGVRSPAPDQAHLSSGAASGKPEGVHAIGRYESIRPARPLAARSEGVVAPPGCARDRL